MFAAWRCRYFHRSQGRFGRHRAAEQTSFIFRLSFGRESALAVFRMRNPKAIFEESAHRTIQICRAECELPGAAKYGLSS